jgi:hypothetical protein
MHPYRLMEDHQLGGHNGGYSRGCRGTQGGVIRAVPMRP